MMSPCDAEAKSVCEALPHGPRVVVIGSTSFWGPDSRVLCEGIAADLAAVEDLVAVTGGLEGVGLTFGRRFASVRRALGHPEQLFHLLPRGIEQCDCGNTVYAGNDFYERREILGRIGGAYLVIEGGPGTKHEAEVAGARHSPLIPVGRTGGFAGELHAACSCPQGLLREDWQLLNESDAPLGHVVAAVGRLVRHALGVPVK